MYFMIGLLMIALKHYKLLNIKMLNNRQNTDLANILFESYSKASLIENITDYFPKVGKIYDRILEEEFEAFEWTATIKWHYNQIVVKNNGKIVLGETNFLTEEDYENAKKEWDNHFDEEFPNNKEEIEHENFLVDTANNDYYINNYENKRLTDWSVEGLSK